MVLGGGVSANSSTSGGGSVSNNPDEKSSQQPKALPPPKDPDVDYSGKSCAYFTRPAEEEGRINYHAIGSCVSYGKSSYECDANGRWLLRGPSGVFRCKTAEELEGSSGEPLRPWIIKKN